MKECLETGFHWTGNLSIIDGEEEALVGLMAKLKDLTSDSNDMWTISNGGFSIFEYCISLPPLHWGLIAVRWEDREDGSRILQMI